MSSEVTAVIWDLRLRPLEKLVLIWIADNQGDFGEASLVEVDKKRLPQFAGENLTACRAAIKHLHELGIVYACAGHVTIIEKHRK